jgi:hypothetical protein
MSVIDNSVHISTNSLYTCNDTVRSLCTSSSSSFFVVSYRLPRRAYTPQLLHVMLWGSRSFKSHLRLRNKFSPGSSNMSISSPHLLFKKSTSCCISHGLYPAAMIGTLVSRRRGNVTVKIASIQGSKRLTFCSATGSVSSHLYAEAGLPKPGWKTTKQ